MWNLHSSVKSIWTAEKAVAFLFLDFENLFNIIIFITFKYFKTY